LSYSSRGLDPQWSAAHAGVRRGLLSQPTGALPSRGLVAGCVSWGAGLGREGARPAAGVGGYRSSAELGVGLEAVPGAEGGQGVGVTDHRPASRGEELPPHLGRQRQSAQGRFLSFAVPPSDNWRLRSLSRGTRRSVILDCDAPTRFSFLRELGAISRCHLTLRQLL
jgi:hypothetical protein